MSTDTTATASQTKHRDPCGCWLPGQRPCWVDEWATERVGAAASDDWTFVVEMDGGQWRVRRQPDGSLEYRHTNF
ncbi:hypothetical protein [Streptomyces brevispora]|uniref:hypothetical protein n=1 Tax=Streptomyces brevispora TaxID=887462 RepID=UPI00381D570B